MSQSDLIELLLKDHKEVENMLGEADHGTQIGELFTRVRNTLETHENAEEQVLYPAVRRYVDGGDKLADARIAEQDEAAELLAQMDKMAPGSAELVAAFAMLKKAAAAHAQAEESEVFPRLRSAVSGDVLVELGRDFAAAKSGAGSGSLGGRSALEQQQDPRGDLLVERPGGATAPGGLVPPYEGRTTSTHEQSDPAAGSDTGGLGQAVHDDLDMSHHKGSPDDAEPELVPNEGQAKYRQP